MAEFIESGMGRALESKAPEKWICDNCDVLDRAFTFRETDYYDTGKPWYWYSCLVCKDEVTEARKCAECGWYVKFHDISCGLCETCAAKADADAVELLILNLSPAQIEYLRESGWTV
jgi:hypothetical protein